MDCRERKKEAARENLLSRRGSAHSGRQKKYSRNAPAINRQFPRPTPDKWRMTESREGNEG
jgi:hypothetical protein